MSEQDEWEIAKIALGYYAPPDVFPEFRSAVWWWRVRLLYGIEDPVRWVVETWQANQIQQVVEYLGVADRKAAYFVMRKCRFALEARERFSEWLDELRSLDLDGKPDDDND